MPVSYTHLDVYKRQLQLFAAVSVALFGVFYMCLSITIVVTYRLGRCPVHIRSVSSSRSSFAYREEYVNLLLTRIIAFESVFKRSSSFRKAFIGKALGLPHRLLRFVLKSTFLIYRFVTPLAFSLSLESVLYLSLIHI